jgi:hypothetical protein
MVYVPTLTLKIQNGHFSNYCISSSTPVYIGHFMGGWIVASFLGLFAAGMALGVERVTAHYARKVSDRAYRNLETYNEQLKRAEEQPDARLT